MIFLVFAGSELLLTYSPPSARPIFTLLLSMKWPEKYKLVYILFYHLMIVKYTCYHEACSTESVSLKIHSEALFYQVKLYG